MDASTIESPAMQLNCIQELATTGARAVAGFVHGGTRYLAVPQLARDVEGQPAKMTLGDSDLEMPVYRWDGGRFVPHASLPVPGGEDAEFFRIGERAFLATASLRSGRDPYTLAVPSTIFELVDGRFEPFQRIDGFAAKQWHHFAIGERHFLALAQGVTLPGEQPARPVSSCLLEWDGTRFVPFQDVPSAWGYNWAFFELGGGRHGVSAALEFALTQLKVEEVVVMGHGSCGGVHASLTGRFTDAKPGEGGFIARWIDMLDEARDRIVARYGTCLLYTSDAADD